MPIAQKPSLLLPALLSATLAQAASIDFVADYTGTSQIVEVIDATGPVVRFETAAAGTGVLDLTQYQSTDIIDMGTGAGTGTNRFTAGNGDELYGSFSVQIVPTATAGVVDLFGSAQFTGGTGQLAGASGAASFTGTGIFTDATTALATLHYSGQITLVPEPASAALMLAGLGAVAARWRTRRPL